MFERVNFRRETDTTAEGKDEEKDGNEGEATHWPSIYLLVAIGVSFQ